MRLTKLFMLNSTVRSSQTRSSQVTATTLSLAALGLGIAPQAQAESSPEPIAPSEHHNQQIQPQPLKKAMALESCDACLRPAIQEPESTIAEFAAADRGAVLQASQPIATAAPVPGLLTPRAQGLNLERIGSVSDRSFVAKTIAKTTVAAPAFASDWSLPEPIAHPPELASPATEANLRRWEARQVDRVTRLAASSVKVEPSIPPVSASDSPSAAVNLQRLEDQQVQRLIRQRIAQAETAPTDQGPDPAAIDRSTLGETSIEEKLRRLEERQQQLIDEIDTLKTQLQTSPAPKPATVIPSRPQGFYGKVDLLMLKPGTTSSIDYGITDPLLGEATATGGQLQKLDLDRQTNLRWGIGYRKQPWDVGFQTLSLQSSASGSAQKPIDGTLYPTLTSPLQNNNADTANANLKIRFNSSDFEVGYTLQPSNRFDLRLFSGLRIADTEQRFNVNYDGGDFTNGEFRFKRNFSGIGPRLGAEARVNLGSGFSVFGRASGSLLIGSSKLRLRETNDSGNEVVAAVSDRNQQQSIPVAEAALGMNWSQAIGKQATFNLGLGYEYQHWFNAFDNARFVDSQAPGAFQTNRGDINFGGLFIEAGVAAKF